ncbi:2-keto-4-pentenoate hydratase [Bradyrhizobium sp. JYMT SZCCT0428]|uniref:2-keto-4-pentenoate hydratase n=1 Tax=Bradyrhizobium sp. JYMT SZCCT0428 TaxID=2807673 RepID=UPI001BA7CD47|nr:fumarylacetoacetate hydrolase family protein [Bradyrhizobium sp. JYMT SZCCT0428]MBR1153378.1 fumarylacetoacetate hydrolase family protein [Bradyrhizobium sp. JYMT SZCCT0428]
MANVDEAASLIATARQKQVRIASLPVICRPRSVKEAHAVQDAVAIKLGATIGGYKATAPTTPDPTRNQDEVHATANEDAPWLITEGVRALIFDTTIYASPCVIPSREMPQCGVEGEIAFRFLCDLPPRATPYTREEIAGVTDAYPAIEVVSSRFALPEKTTFLERLADCVSNGGFVYGSKSTEWQRLRLAELRVMLIVNGETIVDQIGGHPTGDPFGIVVALVEMMRTTTGVSAGQFVTCGSCTGLRYFKPGDVCEVRFEGLGAAHLTFSP